jgi:hypothetical protein
MKMPDAPQIKTFNVLVYNGYRYEFACTVDAGSVKQARKIIKQRWRGDHRADDFRVTLVKPTR